jgi:ribosomal protein L13
MEGEVNHSWDSIIKSSIKKKSIKFLLTSNSHAKEHAARVKVYLHNSPPQAAVKSAILHGRFLFNCK